MAARNLGKRAFKLQNKWRVSQGARTLKWSPPLHVTAKAAAELIVRTNVLRHDKWWYRGMLKVLGGGTEVAENIGWGQEAPRNIIEGWDDSPIHDKIMRDRTLTRGAIATVRSRRNGKRVWVAHYAGK
jgi:uncharacterized protein YkwD